jgi:uncharacterized caspase-like protein
VNRRRLLQGALAAAGVALRPGMAGSLAASPAAAKHALVIGNGKYRHAPLRNPVNDAGAMAQALMKLGFAVALGLDFTQAQMQAAIRAYGAALTAARATGLFYFAGHGAQLDWRNYLLPVDAEIADAAELRERGVDVGTVLDGVRQSQSPMNLIILDACRDNPFGDAHRVDQKGLSQLDAPPGTLLAYATAPGNTASDGAGAHGLYTEHLLREIPVPETKVEDVFKRVRLAVRRRSNGAQIPWESTSLEDDFWFIPPAAARAPGDAEVEEAFKRELALWERIQGATTPEPLEDYLRRHPSGRFTELAQLRLDRVLAKLGEQPVAAVAAPGNPYTKGIAVTSTAYKVGDSYAYRRVDSQGTPGEKARARTVTSITDREVVFDSGRIVCDLLGNTLKPGTGAVWSPNQTVPTDFAVGRRWTTRFHWSKDDQLESLVNLDLRVADRETITVPAGVFNAFRVEARGWRTRAGVRVGWDWKTWYAPERVRQPLAWEWMNRSARGVVTKTDRYELTAFRQS